VASLHGKSLQARARELVNVAHPDFREELERAAKERKLL
jgi:acyl-CoA hydrolase